MENTIESYLQHLVSHGNLNPGDHVLLTSISRQVARSIALTDRQYELVKSKLLNYRKHFEGNNMNDLDLVVDNLKMPLRSVDRSQTIVVEDNHVVVRFPFNKKTIVQLEKISTKYKNFYNHHKGSNEHKFKLYEPVVNEIIETFKTKNFHIQPELLEINNKINDIKNNEFDTIPYVTDSGLINVNDSVHSLAYNEIGHFSKNTEIKYWDRSIRYGYKKVEKVFRNNSHLAEDIANRTSQRMYINPDVYTVNDIARAVKELDRFPLLITLNRCKEFEELKSIFNAFNFISPDQQILLNRIDDKHDDNYAINTFIKEKNFNNWLDKDTKIVYIFKNSRLPKLFFKTSWQPIAHLSLSAEREQTLTATYIEQYCDLNMYHDSCPSYWSSTMSRQLSEWV
jgi:hypothetical protein